MPEFPPVASLVPHAAPLLLLDRVLATAAESIACEVVVRQDGLFDDQGCVPAYVGIEYMAQTVAAFSGYQSVQLGEPVRLGFLLGTRRFDTNVQEFSVGDILQVRANRVVADDTGMAAFDCTVTGDDIQQKATITVYSPTDTKQAIRALRN